MDIATRVVAPDEDIYIMQPGRGYWLYELYDKYDHVFLDFPGLDLEFSAAPPQDLALRQMIVRSLAISGWINNGRKDAEPSRELKDYVGQDRRLRLGRYVGAAKRLYYELKPGTIIVVAGKNPYDDVLIGEIVGKPTMLRKKKLYGGEPVPARKVKWLRRKKRALFSSEVRDRFGTPNPLMQLERTSRKEILKAGFDQYAYEGEYAARLNTATDDFSTLDDYDIQSFVNYVTGALIAFEQGREEKLSMADAIGILRAEPHLALSLAQNINSKGFQRLVDGTVRPLAVALLLTVALEGSAGADPPRIDVRNSATAGGDPCRIEVQARVEGALRLMMLDEWRRVCENARGAQRSTGLSTTMRVERHGRTKR
ncbi:MAG TPA: hypothetical protein VGB79_10030 [Allosphingosinicella sp.]